MDRLTVHRAVQRAVRRNQSRAFLPSVFSELAQVGKINKNPVMPRPGDIMKSRSTGQDYMFVSQDPRRRFIWKVRPMGRTQTIDMLNDDWTPSR